jgi:hypothetical protein
MVGSTLGVYNFGLIFVSARTNKRHHHQSKLLYPEVEEWVLNMAVEP